MFVSRSLLPSFLRFLTRRGVLLVLFLTADGASAEELQWQQIEPGLFLSTYEISSSGAVLRSPVLLAKFDPQSFTFHAVMAADFGFARSDVRSLTRAMKGVAGINANFFDPQGEALGLVVSDGEQRVRLHLGGGVLNGVFIIEQGVPRIVSRESYHNAAPSLALQAGPLLIANGRALEVSAPHAPSRRSGIALMITGEVLLYATRLRFPGATLAEVQHMLLQVGVREALSFDGGGSSQLFLERGFQSEGELFISGGDSIPVALVVRKRHVPAQNDVQ